MHKLLYGMVVCCLLHTALCHWSLQIQNVNKCQHAANCIDYNHYNQIAFWADKWIWMWKGICQGDLVGCWICMMWSSVLAQGLMMCHISYRWDPLTFSVRKVVDVQFFEEKVSDLSVFFEQKYWRYFKLHNGSLRYMRCKMFSTLTQKCCPNTSQGISSLGCRRCLTIC